MWIPSEGELAWRLRAQAFGDYELKLRVGDKEYVKTHTVRMLNSVEQLSHCIRIIYDFAAVATEHGGKTVNSNFHFF